jgi:membrane-bound ClpP family serine protease
MGIFFNRKKEEEKTVVNSYLEDQKSLFDTEGEVEKKVFNDSYDDYIYKPKDYSNIPKYQASKNKKMDILIIIALLVAGIILLLLEVFLFPGISLAGIGATACLIYANIHAFGELGIVPGIITLAISIVSSILVFVWFMRSKSLDRLALKKDIDSSVKQPEINNIHIGDKGISLTRLAQIGNAQFGENIVEVKSAGEFIDAKTPIVVERITNGIITVVPCEN